jgi:hypothetical protein
MEGDIHVLPGWVGALALAAATFRNYRSVNPGSTMTSVGQTPAWNRPARRVTNCARCSRLRRYANEMSSRSACRSERRPVREVLRTGSSPGLQPTRLACLLHRPPFPRLHTKTNDLFLPERCSVCRRALGTKTTMQTWISLRVATDVVPLLVHACSKECVDALPKPPAGYVYHAHAGGLALAQPPKE